MVTQTVDLQVQTKIDSSTPDVRMHGRIITTKVVGVTFENRQELIAKLQMGDRVWLQREPFNRYDKNAIKVTRNDGEKIGYISRHRLADGLALTARWYSDQHLIGSNASPLGEGQPTIP